MGKYRCPRYFRWSLYYDIDIVIFQSPSHKLVLSCISGDAVTCKENINAMDEVETKLEESDENVVSSDSFFNLVLNRVLEKDVHGDSC